MEKNTRFTVDSDHCQRAADELYEILRIRERAYLARWLHPYLSVAVINAMRALGVLLSLLGIVFVAFLRYVDTRAWSTQPPLWFIPLLVAFIAVLVFQPRITASVRDWSLHQADKRARSNALRGLTSARELAPYEADYDLAGELLTYHRTKDGERRLAWFRALGTFRARGFAIQADTITAVFKKPSSLLPAVIILQPDRHWTGTALREVGVTLQSHPPHPAVE